MALILILILQNHPGIRDDCDDKRMSLLERDAALKGKKTA